MSAGNYIGYFARMIEKGEMTEEEANQRLEALFEADRLADEFDRCCIKNCNMTKQEAIELENKCDELMSEYTGKDCSVSLALTGKLKVEFDGRNYITLTKKWMEVDYINYAGHYETLLEIVQAATICIEENKEDFDKLVWSYEHITELK